MIVALSRGSPKTSVFDLIKFNKEVSILSILLRRVLGSVENWG